MSLFLFKGHIMKKLLLAIILTLVSISALADGRHRGPVRYHERGHWEYLHHDRHHSSWQWVVPTIIGGIIVYEAMQPRTIVIEKEVEPNCSPWAEIENPDGTITRTRTCRK